MPSSEWIRDALARHERPLLLYAERVAGDESGARDAVQETFLRLCRERRDAVEPHLAQWLYTVCRNAALDARRRGNRMGSWSEAEVAGRASAECDPAVAIEEGEQGERALHLLAALPPAQQEALRLKFQSGLSYREIAAVTQQPIGTVGWLIHEGLKSLRARMGAGAGREVQGGAQCL